MIRRLSFLLVLFSVEACNPVTNYLPGIPVTLEFGERLTVSELQVIERGGIYSVLGSFTMPHAQLHGDKGIELSIVGPGSIARWSTNYCIHYVKRRVGPTTWLDDVAREKRFRINIPFPPGVSEKIRIRPLRNEDDCRG